MTERVYFLYKNRGRNGLKIEANIEINLLLFFSGDVEKHIHLSEIKTLGLYLSLSSFLLFVLYKHAFNMKRQTLLDDLVKAPDRINLISFFLFCFLFLLLLPLYLLLLLLLLP
jgi:hypothetical protein